MYESMSMSMSMRVSMRVCVYVGVSCAETTYNYVQLCTSVALQLAADFILTLWWLQASNFVSEEASQGCLPEEGAASFVAAILFDAGAHCIKVKFLERSFSPFET